VIKVLLADALMKMKRRIEALAGISVTMAIVLVILWIEFQQSKLAADGRFTIGTTIGENLGGRGPWVMYNFQVGDSVFVDEQRPLKFHPKIYGGRYYVKFLPTDPSINEIYWDHEVPDNFMDAPKEGWAKLPWE